MLWRTVQELFCFVLWLVTLWNIHLAAESTLFTRQSFYLMHTTHWDKSNICFRKIRNLFHYGVFPGPCLWCFVIQHCNPKVAAFWSTCGPKGLQMPNRIVSSLWSFPDGCGVDSILFPMWQIRMITNDIIFELPKLIFRIVICLRVLLMLGAGEGPYWPQGLFLSGAGEVPYHRYCRLLTSLKPHNLRKLKCGLFLLSGCGSGTIDTDLGKC